MKIVTKNNHNTLLDIFPLQGKSMNQKYVFDNKLS